MFSAVLGVARNRGVGVVPSFRASALWLRKGIRGLGLADDFRTIRIEQTEPEFFDVLAA